MIARSRENGWTDLHETFREGVEWPWDDPITFLVNSEKPRDAAVRNTGTGFVVLSHHGLLVFPMKVIDICSCSQTHLIAFGGRVPPIRLARRAHYIAQHAPHPLLLRWKSNTHPLSKTLATPLQLATPLLVHEIINYNHVEIDRKRKFTFGRKPKPKPKVDSVWAKSHTAWTINRTRRLAAAPAEILLHVSHTSLISVHTHNYSSKSSAVDS